MTASNFIKIGIDPNGGSSFTDLGLPTLLTSVPYSLASFSLTATSNGGRGIVGKTSSSLWLGLYEGGVYRGYIGSYAGNNEYMDFGTGGGNTSGKLHLTIQASPALTIGYNKNVGINNQDPTYKFQVDGITGSFLDNGIRINNTTANTGWSLYASATGDLLIGKTGNIGSFSGITGAYTSLSDKRLKTNITNLEPVITKLKNLEAKRYEFIHNNPNHVKSLGFLAQDVQLLFPELVTVSTMNDGQPFVENQLSMDYSGLSVIAIKAIQEQQEQIELLKQEIADLKTLLINTSK